MSDAEVFDVTIYVPFKFSTTLRKRDEKFVKEIERQAKEHPEWKVSVFEHQQTGNRRYH